MYAKAKSIVTPIVVIYYSKRKSYMPDDVRLGITTSKKVGNAVQRSRSRRVIREAFRELQEDIRPGYDFLLIARGKTPFVKSTDIKQVLIKELSSRSLMKKRINEKKTGSENDVLSKNKGSVVTSAENENLSCDKSGI